MGVYIPSLKMPQTCEDCNLESYCSLWVDARRLCGETFTDVNSMIEATIRHPDCPLVEVKPHGRLIDADVLLNKLQALYDKQEEEARYTGSREIKVSWNDAVYKIIDAPTIIQASEEGET